MSKENKKILIVAYQFPPVGGAGVQRGVKFTKYLKKLGWKPYVLTVKNPSVPIYDYSLENDILNDLPIYRALTVEPPYQLKELLYKGVAKSSKGNEESKKGLPQKMLGTIRNIIKLIIEIIFTPDANVGWLPCAYVKAKGIIRNENISYVLITAPPFSSFIIGYWLKKKLNINLILDYRDEWSPFYIKVYNFVSKPKPLRKFIFSLEKNILKCADLIVMASPYFVKNYRRVFPDVNPEKVVAITNGYDPDDLKILSDDSIKTSQKFTIVYTGTIFKLTSLHYFLENLDRFVTNDQLQNKIIFKIYGRMTVDQEELIREFLKKPYVEVHEYIPHQKVISEMVKADVLLLTLSPIEGCERIIPGKLFEYLAVRKNILAVIPNGITSDIVRQSNSGIVVHPNDPGSTLRALIQFYSMKQKGMLRYAGIETEIQKYSREELTRKLIHHMKKVNQCNERND